MQVFISSTYLDLKLERQKAVEGILRAGHIPAGMELFIPSNESQWEIIETWIKDSDVLLLILGGKYGSIEKSSGKSYTQLEYELAQSYNIPVVALVLDKQYLANSKSKNIDLEIYEHETTSPQIDKYNSFKETVKSNLVSPIQDINQIPTEISLILQQFIKNDDSKYYFRGWLRGEEGPDLEKLKVPYLINDFLEDKKRQGLSEKTIESYKIELRIFMRQFENSSIKEIGTSDIKDFLRHRKDNSEIKSTNSLEKIRGILNIFFDWLFDEGLIEKNPVKKVKAFKIHKAGNTSLNKEEIKLIREACSTNRDRSLIEIFLSTGCLLGEVAALKRENIDFEAGTILIKNGERSRTLLISNRAKEILERYIKERSDNINSLFITERRPYRQLSNSGIQNIIRQIVKSTSIEKNVTPRIFRHTFTKQMLSQGVDGSIVEALLGYSSKSIRSERYFRMTNESIREYNSLRPDF